jgi:NADH-quinone oxidoreductase subunit J
MEAVLFWFFTACMLQAAVGVIVSRNPVASALCLVLSIVFMAALFVMLNAYFLAAVQVLVYAGAVMVLFLFIIMLLDLKAEKRRARHVMSYLLALALILFIADQFAVILDALPQGVTPVEITKETGVTDVRQIGKLLFTKYLLPFEVTSILLLVATVGVVVLCRKTQKNEA